MDAKEKMLDTLGVLQDKDAISGAETKWVANQIANKSHFQMESSNKVYKKYLQQALFERTGINASKLLSCAGAQNETVL